MGTLSRAVWIALAVVATILAVRAVIRATYKSRFLGPIQYNPLFLDPLGNRIMSKGYSSGSMPSVEEGSDGGALCCGLIGV
ncbi:MAG: hypothetical protein KGL39_09405 [Patescibacteria group bacterium]|nr:hypothetical protein [Patescibacteria group bacterium]